MRRILMKNKNTDRKDKVLAQQTDNTITQEDFIIVRILDGWMGSSCA